MDRLLYVIAHTTDFDATKRFYRDQLGLAQEQDNPYWADFRTAGARLAVMAVHPGMACEIEIALHVPELDAMVARLRARRVTFMGDIKIIPHGRHVHLRDPNGTLISLYAPHRVPEALEGPQPLTLMVNADDPAATVSFYRDVLDLEVADAQRGWVEFATGGTRLAVHRRPHGGEHPEHAAQKVVVGLEVPNLDAAADAMRARGLHFSTAPTDADFGPYAEATDPEGSLVVLREPAPEPALEDVLAAAFDDGDSPARLAIRKPVNKTSKAMSRVVIKPDYRPRKQAAARSETTRARRAAAASTRGAGPAGTRLKPKTTRDVKRAKSKPASGRAQKASARTAAKKKRAVARASKVHPVKKAASRGARRR